MDKKDSPRETWESICQKWGMIIVRELIYTQNSVLEEHDIRCIDHQHVHDNNSINESSNHGQLSHISSSSIIIDGCEAFKVKDQLVIANLIDQNGNKLTKLDDENINLKNECSMDSYKRDCLEEIPSSIAQKIGLEPGDVIYAAYGMKNPKLGLLYRIMKHAPTFQ